MTTRIEIFDENSIDELTSSVNSFVASLPDIEILDISLTETEYSYKILMVYDDEHTDDDISKLTAAILKAAGKKHV
jgi:hypothetical protein